jgi:hypothetical protein
MMHSSRSSLRKRSVALQQVEAARAKLEAFELGIAQTRVTRDESQVSVGGLLALDQVLKLLGHV